MLTQSQLDRIELFNQNAPDSDSARLMAHVKEQQAEIERLKAEMTAIQSLIAYRGTDFIAKVYEIAERNSDIQQQPEPPQESLKVRILQELTTGAMSVFDIGSSLKGVKLGAIEDELGTLLIEKRIKKAPRFRGEGTRWKITAAGRDYLANNESETLQRATSIFVECPQCHQQTLNLVHEFCSECDYIKAE